jgi:hypothetical protein
VTAYGLGDGSSIPDRGRGFFLYPLRSADCGAHPASSTMSTGDLPLGKFDGGALLTTNPFYCRGLRKRGAILLLQLCVRTGTKRITFAFWIGVNSLFLLIDTLGATDCPQTRVMGTFLKFKIQYKHRCRLWISPA